MMCEPSQSAAPAVLWLDGTEQLAMRQLRHHSKNALQHLLCQVAGYAGLHHDRAGRALAAELERRIMLSADLSDALFGLTRAPGPLASRLEAMVQSAIGLASDGDQLLTAAVTVDGHVPATLDSLLVRIAHELVGNAVKHGMTLRMVGRIDVDVRLAADRVIMRVRDDGWGLCGTGRHGEGLGIAHSLAEQHCGTLTLGRAAGLTIATLDLPLSSRTTWQ